MEEMTDADRMAERERFSLIHHLANSHNANTANVHNLAGIPSFTRAELIDIHERMHALEEDHEVVED